MGWTKRDSDVKYVRGMYESQRKAMERLAQRAKDKEIDLLPEAVDNYITLCHMVGVQPDRASIHQVLEIFSRARTHCSWRCV